MKILSLLSAISILSFSVPSFAIVNEISADFGYDRKIYGLERENSNISRTYSAGISTYLFDYTAIDLNASKSTDITSINQRDNVLTGYDLVARQDRVVSNVYGVGIKQMFAPRNARLIPGISIGYAKQFLQYDSDLTIENVSTKVRTIIKAGSAKQRIDSVFGSFSLQLRMTERLSLRASARTLIPAVELDKVRDNLKYSVGFAWIF